MRHGRGVNAFLPFLVEDGAIRIIARAAQRTTSVDVVRLCACTLCNFAGDSRARPKMSDRRTAQVKSDIRRDARPSYPERVGVLGTAEMIGRGGEINEYPSGEASESNWQDSGSVRGRI